jgi:hypothetical protein
MPKANGAVALLAALALVPPGKADTGPTGAAGTMVLDEVADGLRRYRRETDPQLRVRWLEKLAPTRDPRVAVALWEADCEDGAIKATAVRLLGSCFVEGTRFEHLQYYDVGGWWKANEAGIRRRVAQLPQ